MSQRAQGEGKQTLRGSLGTVLLPRPLNRRAAVLACPSAWGQGTARGQPVPLPGARVTATRRGLRCLRSSGEGRRHSVCQGFIWNRLKLYAMSHLNYNSNLLPGFGPPIQIFLISCLIFLFSERTHLYQCCQVLIIDIWVVFVKLLLSHW